MQKQVVIIGAGISGLMAAQQLRLAGISVIVLDKGNRPGGRMATRPFEGALFDYGAQFFTVRQERFAAFQRAWQAKGLVRVWSNGFNGQQDGHPRFIGQSGINAIPAHLAQGIDLRCGVKVSHIIASGNQWTLEIDLDETLTADALIVTAPVPQTLSLLDFDLNESERTTLERIQYERCITVMAILEEPAKLPEPGAMQMTGAEPISWISDNHRKGISTVENSITIHAGPKFSLNNWEKNAEDVAGKLLTGYKVSAWKLHRWKYSKPSVMHEDRSFVVTAPAPLILAGDAFGEARIEGAALSGLSAAERLLALL